MEKTQSLISPYTCYGLRALRYGWSTAVPWSHLFVLHVYGLRLMLWIMGHPRPRVQQRIHCSDAAYAPFISKFVQQLPSSTLSVLFFMEKTQSLTSPYTCHGLYALRHGWSAVVPWSRLLPLHVHGLCAQRYGLGASRGHRGQ